MTDNEHRLIEAWRVAARELGIEIASPGTLVTEIGKRYDYPLLVLEFGRPNGTICFLSRSEPHDSPDFASIADAHGYFVSVLYDSYLEYDRDLFVATLDDWQWFGGGAPPGWYTGTPWS